MHVDIVPTSSAVYSQEFDQQDDARRDVLPATSAALLSPAAAETVTQSNSNIMSGSDMVPDLGISQQVSVIDSVAVV